MKQLLQQALDALTAIDNEVSLELFFNNDVNETPLNGIAADAIEALRQAIAQPGRDPVRYEYQLRDGSWHTFISDKHFNDTKADGRWPIRALYAALPEQAETITRLNGEVGVLRGLLHEAYVILDNDALMSKIENALKVTP